MSYEYGVVYTASQLPDYLNNTPSGEVRYWEGRNKRDNKGRFVRGIVSWNKGVRNTWYDSKGLELGHGWNRGRRSGKNLVCLTCKTKFYAFPSQIKQGRKYCSHNCEPHEEKYKNILKNPMRKENHYNWKGGITPLRKQIRELVLYKIWRDKIFKRDKYVCQICGAKNGNGHKIILNADHYPIRFSEIIDKFNVKAVEEAKNTDLFWKTSNGRTLCINCHLETL